MDPTIVQPPVSYQAMAEKITRAEKRLVNLLTDSMPHRHARRRAIESVTTAAAEARQAYSDWVAISREE